jgi:DNA-binding LytR/AlgR family response regulator
MQKLNSIIVDDDEIDRLMVLSFVKRFPIFNILGSFESPAKALEKLKDERIDVAFLDIDMPSLSGINFRKKSLEIPACIFITNHPEFAVDSFEVETLDFIVKPLKFERFERAVGRIIEFMELKQKAHLFEVSIGGDTIFIKEGYEQTKIKLHEILYLEALKDYTLLVTSEKRHCILSSIGNLLKETHFQSFIRIHRSYAVQKQFIEKIGSQNVILFKDISIPIGNSYKENLNLLL